MLKKEALRVAATTAYEAEPDHALSAIREVYEAIITAIDQCSGKGGDRDEFRSRSDFGRVCSAIDEQLEDIGMLPDIRRRLAAVRLRIRQNVEAEQGWAKTRNADGGARPVVAEAFNRLRRKLEMQPALIVCGQEALSAEEFQQLHSLATSIGAKALAKFIAITRNLPFDDTVEALTKHLGTIDRSPGGPPLDAPVAVLDDARFAFLRETLRNHHRDQLEGVLAKDGIEAVLALLAKARETQLHPLQQAFYYELAQFFQQVDASQPLPTLKPGLVPRRNQWEVAWEVLRHGSYLDAKYMGGGKTLTACLTAEFLLAQKKIDAVWVICPSNVLNDVWCKRLSDGTEGYYAGDPKAVFISTKKGKEGDERRAEEWAAAADATYTVLTIERANGKTQGVTHLEWLRRNSAGKRVLLIVDEAHNLRDAAGAESKRVFDISQLPAVQQGYLLLLTGTPADGDVRDLASIIRLLYANRTLPLLPGAENSTTPPALLEDDGQNGEPHCVDFADIRSIAKTIAGSPEFARAIMQAKMLRRTAAQVQPVGTELCVEAPRVVDLPPLVYEQCEAIKANPFLGTLEKIQMMEMLLMQARLPHLIAAIDECLHDAGGREGHPGKFVIAASGRAKGVTRDASDMNTIGACDAEAFVAGRLRLHYEQQGVPIGILDGSNTGNAPLRDSSRALRVDPVDEMALTRTREVIAGTRDHQGPAGFFTRPDVAGQGISLVWAQYLIEAGAFYTDGTWQQMVGRLYRPGQQWNVRVLTLLFRGLEEAKWGRRQIMARILRKILDDEDLSDDEHAEMEQEVDDLDDDGPLKPHTMTKPQRIAQLFSRLFAGGKEHVRRFFALRNGHFARELAEAYFEVEDTSLAGNNRRVLTAILDQVTPDLRECFGAPLQVANIACGCLRLERALTHRSDLEFHSSDLCEAMLEVGRSDFPIAPAHVHACAMDEIPYAMGSKHVAIHSLALHYAAHNQRRQTKGGCERREALTAWSDCIREGGVGLLALPPVLFENEPDKPGRIAELLERCYGMQRIPHLTGKATSTDREDEKPFETYVWTMRKVGPCRSDLFTDEDWMTLTLRKPSGSNGNGTVKKKPQSKDKAESQGSFHNQFLIGETRLACCTPQDTACAAAHDVALYEYRTLTERIRGLRDKYGNFADIPKEELLSISLDEVHEADQHEKNRYFKALLAAYHGDVYRIPLEKIATKTSLILVLHTAKKGAFLAISTVGQQGSWQGKRYFVEDEFAPTSQPVCEDEPEFGEVEAE